MSVLTSRFDTRIEIELLSQSKIDYEVQNSWSFYKYTYATMTKKSNGNTTIDDGSVFYDVNEFYIRFDKNIETDFRNYRIVYKNKYYRIVSCDTYERNKTLALTATKYENE